ncbi:hypothetical protein CMI47_22085 [Candidatus Pacearchaeota archaeon]|nr:hypothetical protein [Candidatus Pacearchaeota archaeon]|tara:strand:+ start:7374 stop:8225 length:852 start_codon:yes stop_codon:yes gene_type:complete
MDLMNTAVVTPIIGEFGWTLFEVQDKVRWFFKNTTCERKVVIAPHSLHFLFDEATHIIELPDNMKNSNLPEALGKQCQHNSISYYESLIKWTAETFNPKEILTIPYNIPCSERWDWKSEHKMFKSSCREWEPHICVSARDVKERGEGKNWSHNKWDALIKKVKKRWNLPIISIGLPGDTYVPKEAEFIECDTNDYLETAVSCINSATFFFSSNSGTTHLSLLSGCPTFSWGDSDNLTKRMENETNPFNIECKCLNTGWDPDVKTIFNELKLWYEEKICKQQLV